MLSLLNLPIDSLVLPRSLYQEILSFADCPVDQLPAKVREYQGMIMPK